MNLRYSSSLFVSDCMLVHPLTSYMIFAVLQIPIHVFIACATMCKNILVGFAGALCSYIKLSQKHIMVNEVMQSVQSIIDYYDCFICASFMIMNCTYETVVLLSVYDFTVLFKPILDIQCFLQVHFKYGKIFACITLNPWIATSGYFIFK